MQPAIVALFRLDCVLMLIYIMYITSAGCVCVYVCATYFTLYGASKLQMRAP